MPNRIKAGTYVESRDVRYCVEVFLNSGDSSAAVSFVRELQPLLSDRPELKAQLLAREGSIQIGLAKFQDAADSFQASLSSIEPVHLEVDLLRLTTLVNLGESLLSVDRKKEAEGYFQQALSYPWYTILGHPAEMQNLRDQYVAAGRGLIQARRGNLKALKEIVFVPATYEVLGPVLDEAVKEAQAAQPQGKGN
jgi:tetratricopeptide (TPR) repeat protein